MLVHILGTINQDVIFPALSRDHQFQTQVMSDNHYTSLIRLISEKYIRMRVQKMIKLMSDHHKEGNFITRIRIISFIYLFYTSYYKEIHIYCFCTLGSSICIFQRPWVLCFVSILNDACQLTKCNLPISNVPSICQDALNARI